jgi:hypothetical protein
MGNCVLREAGIEDSDDNKIDDEKLVNKIVYIIKYRQILKIDGKKEINIK